MFNLNQTNCNQLKDLITQIYNRYYIKDELDICFTIFITSIIFTLMLEINKLNLKNSKQNKIILEKNNLLKST